MVWYGMVWYGTVWYCMVLYGTVWYGTVLLVSSESCTTMLMVMYYLLLFCVRLMKVELRLGLR